MCGIFGKVTKMRRYETIPVETLRPYANNARTHSPVQVKKIADSIKEFGFINPILVDQDLMVIAGHGRLEAAKALGLDKVPCLFIEDLTDAQKRAYILADNKLAEEAGWDENLLKIELDALKADGFDVAVIGFDENDDIFTNVPDNVANKYSHAATGALAKKFIVPPFSILDARQGAWQDRKRVWKSFIDSGAGRGDGLIGGGGLDGLAKDSGTNLTGTSIFDPVLCEILVQWFSPRGGRVIDPFAGGSVRGIVTAALDRTYYGNDLSAEQVKQNRIQAEALIGQPTVYGTPTTAPTWTIGDSQDIDELIPEADFDLLLTCPPYGDLEVYSDDPQDISNMKYSDFLAAYRNILKKSVEKLKENAFAAVVVGEIRDENGHYRNFIGDTIRAMEDAGMHYYNECILITAVSTLCLRAGRQFEASRKLGNTHQKALVFLKSNGDEKALEEYMASFDQTKQLEEMKQNILIFLKGNSKLAKSDIETYDFMIF